MIRYKYLRILTKSIKDYDTRALIASEFMDHIDDQKAAYIRAGMSSTEAEKQAVLDMGDPEEVASRFAEVYKQDTEIKNLLLYGVFSLLGLLLVWCLTQTDVRSGELARIIFLLGGYLMMLYGLFSGAQEKWMNFPFYYGKNQSGGVNLNSYGICVVGTALVSQNYFQWIVWTILLGGMLWLERNLIGKE